MEISWDVRGYIYNQYGIWASLKWATNLQLAMNLNIFQPTDDPAANYGGTTMEAAPESLLLKW
jgi:hypothetical protein